MITVGFSWYNGCRWESHEYESPTLADAMVSAQRQSYYYDSHVNVGVNNRCIGYWESGKWYHPKKED